MSRPLIVLCNSSYIPDVGGIERWMELLAPRLHHRCDLLVMAPATERSAAGRHEIDGIEVERYPGPPAWLPDRFAPRWNGRGIARIVRSRMSDRERAVFNFFDPRAEHVHAAEALRKRGATVVFTAGGTASETSPETFKRRAREVAHFYVGISRYALRAAGVPDDRGEVFHPIPVDPPVSTSPPAGDTVLSVCRLHPRKNLESVIRIAARAPGTSFVIAGEGSPDYSAALRAAAGDNVAFVGERTGASLEELYPEARVFFLPTKHEMFGLAFAEALAHGVPVVAPNHTGIPEAVPEGGILYEDGDEDAALTALESLQSSDELWAELSTAGRGLMEERKAEDLIGLYADFLLEKTGL